MKLFLYFILMLPEFLNSQTVNNLIYYYKPYTDTIENNFYLKVVSKIHEIDLEVQSSNLKAANIDNEISNAISHLDFRLIAISGYSYMFPGFDNREIETVSGQKISFYNDTRFRNYLSQFGFKVILGTSDSYSIKNYGLQSIAYEFARAYNEQLIKKMRIIE